MKKPERWLKVHLLGLTWAIIHRSALSLSAPLLCFLCSLLNIYIYSDTQMMTGASHENLPGRINSPEQAERPRVITPFPSPKLRDLPMVWYSRPSFALLYFVAVFFFFSFEQILCCCLNFWSFLYQFHGEHKESLYWGTYRPQVYFGVRARYRLRNL